MADELICYFRGRSGKGDFLPISEAKVSVLDRGGGGSVYDVERTFNGKLFRMDAHMDRLYRSLKYVRIDPRMTKEEMTEITEEVVRLNEHLRGNSDWSVNQTVSRGAPLSNATGRISAILDDVPPTIFINVYEPPFARYAHLQEVGCHVIFPHTRNYHHSALDSKVKHHSRMNATMAMLEVVDADPEAWPVLLDHDGYIAEGTGSNFFVVENGVLYTPDDKNILEGISRDTVIVLAKQLGIPVVEEDLQIYDAYNADEAFVTGTSHSMIPVSKIDWRPMPQPVPGPIVNQLLAAWSEWAGLDIVGQARAQAGLTV